MFDWKVDEEAEWDEPQRPFSPQSPRRRPGRWLWPATAVILILAAGLFYSRLDRQVAQTNVDLTDEVTAAFRLLWQADRQTDADLFEQLRHDTGINAWRTEMDRAFAHGLLFDRTSLGFTLTGAEPEVMAVAFSPDWQTAVLTAQIAYASASGPDPIHLNFPLFYERIEGRWLLVPSPDDYWGELGQKNGPILTLYYPQPDAHLASRLHEDLEQTIDQACRQLAQMDQLATCPPDLTLTLRLQPRPGRLESLLATTTQNPFMLPPNPIRRSSFDVGLPTFSLLGLAEDEAAYTAVRDVLSYHLLAAILNAQVDDEQLATTRHIWLHHQLDQLGLNPWPDPPAPDPLFPPPQPPAAEVALLCADLTNLAIDLLRLTPETADLGLLYANADHDKLDSLFQGQVLGLRSTRVEEFFRHDPYLLLHADGTPLTLPAPPNPSLFFDWSSAPSGQTAVAISRSDSEWQAINLTACLTDDEANCRWYSWGNWPIWSPDGQQQLFMVIDEEAETGSTQRRIQRGSLSNTTDVVDVGLSASVDFSPFWVDETTYGYAQMPSDPTAQPSLDFELVLADIADDEPELLITAADLRALLPADPLPDYMLPQGIKRVIDRPDQFVIGVALFPSGSLLNVRPQQAAFFYDQTSNELELLALGDAMFVTPNGRFLLQWPPRYDSLREMGASGARSWQLEWLDLTTGITQQLAWPQQPGDRTAVPAYDWSPLDEWFLLLANNTLLLVDALNAQSGYTIPLAEYLDGNYHCFDAVWMRTADSTTD